MRKKLTDTAIKALKAAAPGKRYMVWDSERPRLAVRVTDKGAKSFVHVARVSGANMTRRAIGSYPTVSLSQARATAAQWDAMIGKGIDPKLEARRQRDEAERAKQAATGNLFGVRAEEWLHHCRDQRRIYETGRIMRVELLPHWGDLPVDEVTSKMIKLRVLEVAARAPGMASQVLRVAKGFFGWCEELEHVQASPAAAIKPKRLIGSQKPRQRVLNPEEIVAFWNATDQLGAVTYRSFYRLLLLTGVRLREAAGARWQEIDFDRKVWIVPHERFKSDAEHIVPLSDAVVQLLNALPRIGEFVFTLDGRKPLNGFHGLKRRLDALTGIKGWVVHDLRRTCRTGLAALRVPDHVAELVIGHSKAGLQRVYDLHRYEDELRDALTRWARHVQGLVDPDPANVVTLRSA